MTEPHLGELVPAAAGPRPGGEVALGRAGVRELLGQMWLESVRSDNGRAAYRRDLEHFYRWADDHGVDVLSALQVHLDAYRRHLETGEHAGRYHGRRSYAPATIARKLAALSSFYRYAVRHSRGLVPANPLEHVARPEVADESMTPGLSLAETERLLDAATAAGPRMRALVLLLVGTGLRVSEAVKADTGDLSTERGKRVLRVTRKGGRQQRVVVPAAADAALREYLRGRQGPLFLDAAGRRRMTRQQVDYYLRRLARAAGLDKPVSPHVLRHTAATLALDGGAELREVQVQLGHRRPETTARYDRSRRDLDNRAAQVLAALVDAAGRRRGSLNMHGPADDHAGEV